MDLAPLIKKPLWQAISNTYESENYSHAILDAMHYLSDVLRDKTGLDNDGEKLVGAALGGNSPLLQINKLQTETEKTMQSGLIQILIGMYKFIRNPRSHEQITDTKNTADAIILFIDQILDTLEQSQEPFTIEGFLDRVFDDHFVYSARYAELLVKSIPKGKLFDTLIALYRERGREVDKTSLIVTEIYECITDKQLDDFFNIVSEDLRSASPGGLRLTMNTVLPPKFWGKLEESSKLRSEYILMESLQQGISASEKGGLEKQGIFAFTMTRYFPQFSQQEELRDIILYKLDGNESHQHYIYNYFLNVLPDLYSGSEDEELLLHRLVHVAKNESGNSMKSRLSQLVNPPENWKKAISASFPDMEYLDIPF